MIAITPTDAFAAKDRRRAWPAGATSSASLVHRWEEKNPKVLALGDGLCAVVAYDFEIDYEMGGHLVECAVEIS